MEISKNNQKKINLCPKCNKKEWTCLNCTKKVDIQEFNLKLRNKSGNQLIALYCNCCQHKFICMKCYLISPTYKKWRKYFDENDLVKSAIDAESDYNQALGNLFG